MIRVYKIKMQSLNGFGVALLLLSTACGFQAERVQKIDQYFALEHFIQGQIKQLDTLQLFIEKVVELDGKTETIQIKTDSAVLAKEFQFWIEADINKPVNQDAFHIAEKEVEGLQLITYTPKEDTKQTIKKMEIYRDEHFIKSIKIHYESENTIYFSERKLLMTFNNHGVLEEYSIKGYQKMILKTPVVYQIKGNIITS